MLILSQYAEYSLDFIVFLLDKMPLQAEIGGLSIKMSKIYLAKGNDCFLPVESLLIKGVHNWLNALAACALAEAAGITS